MEKTCIKIGYDTRRDATKAAVATHNRSRKSGKPSVYECAWCERWHWGHQHPTVAKRPPLAPPSCDAL